VEFAQLTRRSHVAGRGGFGIAKRATFEFRKVLGYLLATCARRQQSVHPADVAVVLIRRRYATQPERIPVFVEDPADPVLNLPTATLSFIHGAFGN
jgi:hypothetical protein